MSELSGHLGAGFEPRLGFLVGRLFFIRRSVNINIRTAEKFFLKKKDKINSSLRLLTIAVSDKSRTDCES